MKISVSALTTYWRCPEMYRKIYVAQEVKRAAPNEPMVIGIATHAAVEAALLGRRAGADVPMATLLAIADAKIDKESKRIKLDPADVFGNVNIGDRVRPVVYSAIRAYVKGRLPYVNPVEVELQFSIEWTEGVQITGAIDLIDELHDGTRLVRDLKVSSSGRTPDTDSAEKSVQLAVYSIVYGRLTGEDPVWRGTLDHFVNSKRPHYLSRTVDFTPEYLSAIALRVDRTVAAIKAGVFPPGDPYWSCTPNKCHLWKSCPMGAGVSKKDGEEDES